MNIAVRAGNLEVLQSLVGKVSLVTGSISTIGLGIYARPGGRGLRDYPQRFRKAAGSSRCAGPCALESGVRRG
jgi:hypothetical protein